MKSDVVDHPTQILLRAGLQGPGAVTLMGFLRHSRGVGFDAMRTLGRYAMVYLLAGGGTYSDDRGRSANVSAGDLIIVYPDVAHAYGPSRGQLWNEIYIIFDGPACDAWRPELEEVGPVIKPLQPLGFWLDRILEIARKNSPLARLGCLQVLLAEIVDAARDRSSAGVTWLRQAQTLLSHEPQSPAADPKRVARTLGVPYELFRKRFRAATGLAPGKFRDAALIHSAADLLRDPTVRLGDIAKDLGFCDEFHLSKRFKQFIGVSPREFRQRASIAKESE